MPQILSIKSSASEHYHAAEHLYGASRAALGKDAPEALVLAEQLKGNLLNGQVDQVIANLKTHAERVIHNRRSANKVSPKYPVKSIKDPVNENPKKDLAKRENIYRNGPDGRSARIDQ